MQNWLNYEKLDHYLLQKESYFYAVTNTMSNSFILKDN